MPVRPMQRTDLPPTGRCLVLLWAVVGDGASRQVPSSPAIRMMALRLSVRTPDRRHDAGRQDRMRLGTVHIRVKEPSREHQGVQDPPFRFATATGPVDVGTGLTWLTVDEVLGGRVR